MKTLTTMILSSCMALAAGSALAEDAMKKDQPMDSSKPATMTMKDCKAHMAMAAKEGTVKDEAMMKKDTMCADMMKKDSGAMDKSKMPAEPAKQ